MDAREKVIERLAFVFSHECTRDELTSDEVAKVILTLPELEAYFREKFENEPGRLVAEKECEVCKGREEYCSLCQLSERHQQCVEETCIHCNGRGAIKRCMTRKEVEEWAVRAIKLANGFPATEMNDAMTLDSGERVSLEGK